MLKIYFQSDTEIGTGEGCGCFESIAPEKIFWVDLLQATHEELSKVQQVYEVDFEKLKAENVLESNARFYEADDLAFISANFISVKGNQFESSPVFLYLLGDILITERESELTSFTETIKKIKRNRKLFKIGDDVLEGILEVKVEVDSDYIEQIAKEIAAISRKLSLKVQVDKESLLLKVSEYQEATTLSRESFIDKQRVVSSLMKTNVFKNTERFKILMKDINAMLEYTNFIFMRLEFLQNTILGLLNIDQNKTIKIFTIVAVIFMPPTLIASIHGMNFKYMPELNLSYGYPLALFFIVSSSLLTLFIFKWKKWL